jgi:formylglycine-generating enzyme
MVPIERASGVIYGMDATEVTQMQFAEFLGCTSAESCASAADAPCKDGAFDPVATPQHPVMCVSWRVANDYCTWAGKRLCARDELGPACASTWARVSGGQLDIKASPEACVLSAFSDGEWGPPSASAPVGSAPDCRGKAAPFDRVFDAIGNADEWVVGCDRGECVVVGRSHHGGSNGNACNGTPWAELDPSGELADPDVKFPQAGLRCCADM